MCIPFYMLSAWILASKMCFVKIQIIPLSTSSVFIPRGRNIPPDISEVQFCLQAFQLISIFILISALENVVT